MRCRACGALLEDVFLDLGCAPPSNAFLKPQDLKAAEMYFPLRLFACASCRLVQVDEVQSHRKLFSPTYAYFSSYSSTWLAHAKRFVEQACASLDLDGDSLVIEVASNDGYLLQYVRKRDIPCLGIEPTMSTAQAARSKGIETIERFFGLELADELVGEGRRADLIVANNVLAHVPDLGDFVAGLARVLAPEGTISIEIPHLMELVAHRQFDTIYHEHFSYFSLASAQVVLAASGLRVWNVERLATHGGSLRLWVSHESSQRADDPAVDSLLAMEAEAGMTERAYYQGFQSQADEVKNAFLGFLLERRSAGSKVAGYGAAAKGNTLLNYAGVKPDLLPYVVDASPHKQGMYLPGSRIPVVAENRLRAERPDFVVVLPWNLRQEITQQLAYIREWGGRFVTAIPGIEIT